MSVKHYRLIPDRDSVPIVAEGRAIRSSAELYATFRDWFEERMDREHFVVFFFNQKNKVMGYHVVSIGSMTAGIVCLREVFAPALYAKAVRIIVAHNHPSGDPTPSREDIELTNRLRECGRMLGIEVMDHLIFGYGKHMSFVDDGYWRT